MTTGAHALVEGTVEEEAPPPAVPWKAPTGFILHLRVTLLFLLFSMDTSPSSSSSSLRHSSLGCSSVSLTRETEHLHALNDHGYNLTGADPAGSGSEEGPYGALSAAEKTFACPVMGCDVVCRSPVALQEHSCVHTGDRPYRCRFGCTTSSAHAPKTLRCRADGRVFRTATRVSLNRHEKKCHARGDRTLEDTESLPFDSLIVPGMITLGALGSAAAQAAYSTALALNKVVSDLEAAGSEPAAVIQAAHIRANDAVSRAQLLTDALKLAPLVEVDKAPESARDTPCACLSISDAARAACGCSDPVGEAARRVERARLKAAMLELGLSVPWYLEPRDVEM